MCSSFRLQTKSPNVIFRGQLARQNHLKGHDAIEVHLASFVDDSHPATGDLFDQFVVPKVPHKAGC